MSYEKALGGGDVFSRFAASEGLLGDLNPAANDAREKEESGPNAKANNTTNHSLTLEDLLTEEAVLEIRSLHKRFSSHASSDEAAALLCAAVRSQVRKLLAQSFPRPLSVDVDFKFEPLWGAAVVVELSLGEEKETVNTSLGLSVEDGREALNTLVKTASRLAWLVFEDSPLYNQKLADSVKKSLALKSLASAYGSDLAAELSAEDVSLIRRAAKRVFGRQPHSFESWSNMVTLAALEEGISLASLSSGDCLNLFLSDLSPEEALLWMVRRQSDDLSMLHAPNSSERH